MKQTIIPTMIMLFLMIGTTFAYDYTLTTSEKRLRASELQTDVIKVTMDNPVGKIPIRIITTGQDQARSSYSKA